MIGKYKWLVIPPAAAVILFLGPFRQGGITHPTDSATTAAAPAGSDPAEGAAPDAATGADTGTESATPAVLRMPDLWQVMSTLVGVLLLGGVGIVLLGRLRNGVGGGAGSLVTLRQSLRLGSRQHLHAVEFDGNVLLLGEVEGKLTVLHTGAPPEHIEEEAVLAETAEEGAVPRNLVIPRPPEHPRTSPEQRGAGKHGTAIRGAGARSAAELSDFRSLLRKVRSGQQA